MTFPSRTTALRVLCALSVGVLALQGAMRVAASEPSPWPWVGVFAVGSFCLAGPVAWLIRDRVPPQRRESLVYVAGGLAVLSVPLVLGFGMLFGWLGLVLDAGVVGGIVGLGVALLLERTVVPERLRTAAR